jgi:hypothetical protein
MEVKAKMTNKIPIEFIVNTKSIDKAFRDLNKRADDTAKRQQLNAAGMRISTRGVITDMKTGFNVEKGIASQRLANHKQQMASLKAEFGMHRKVEGARLGMNLSLMFAGMQLQRTFNSVLRALITTYNTANQGQSALSKSTTRLSAGWEFLKFSIVNALDQPGVIAFIDNLGRIIDGVSTWVNETDGAGEAIFGTFAFLAGAGGLLMLFGQISLAWFGTMNFMAAQTASTAAVSTGAPIYGVMSKLATAIGLLLGLWFVIQGIKSIMTEDDIAQGIINFITGGFLLKGKAGIGIPIWLVFQGMKMFDITAAEGAGIGAIAGTVVAPGIGTGVGAAIGGLFGFLAESSNNAQTEVSSLNDTMGKMNNQTDVLRNESLPPAIERTDIFSESVAGVGDNVVISTGLITDYISELNRIPENITTTITTRYVTEGDNSSTD